MATDVPARLRPALSARRVLRLPLGSSAAEVRTLLILGAVSGVCYLLLYLAQRALFLNGLPAAGDGAQSLVLGVVSRGTPPDGAALRWQLAAYYGGTVGLFACYARILWRCRPGLGSALARRIALAIPVAFHLGLLFGRPTLSRDVYTYIAHGYLAARLGVNPYTVPASAVADTALGHELLSAGWLLWREAPPDGPRWTICEALALYTTDSVPLAVLLLKALVAGASLGSAALIWRILGLVAPQIQLLGTVAFLWNPLIALEIAGDGHNDALMALCILAALVATLRLRPSGTVLGLILGALVKYLALLFLPAQLVYLYHSARGRPGLLRRALW